MKLSDKTDELFKAFSKFQGELDNATKNATNPGVRNKYADLAQCINTAKPVLAQNGLAVSQMLGTSECGKQTLITMITHESGQYMMSEFPLVDAMLQGQAGKNPAQVLGSAITYQRRYAFAAIIGMAQQDDDANSVTPQGGSQQHRHQQQVNNQQAQPINNALSKKESPDEILNRAASAMINANMGELKDIFSKAQAMLKGHDEQLTKLADCKDIRKAELEVGDM